MNLRIGVICPSDIAYRRFLPSLQKVADFTFAGVAFANPLEWFGNVDSVSNDAVNRQQSLEYAKAKSIVEAFGGQVFDSYMSLVTSDEIDAVYLPLPPALHYKWARLALENGKHILLEKPFTTNLADTQSLLAVARERGLAVHEDYMFIYHNQLKAINAIIQSGEIGKVRHYRIQFGFPHRPVNDFRYNKALGGGALLDCGGYTIKYASMLLGPTARITASSSYYEDNEEVDIFGSATLVNDEGVVAQISFGMDNNYKCMVEAWGSLGTLTTCRVLTAPDGFEPDVVIRKGNDEETRKLPSDEAFVKSINYFRGCILHNSMREDNYHAIERQAIFIDEFLNHNK